VGYEKLVEGAVADGSMHDVLSASLTLPLLHQRHCFILFCSETAVKHFLFLLNARASGAVEVS